MLPGKVSGTIIRERGAALRQAGAHLARRFRESQIDTVRPGVTLGDGTLVVTDNYLKVRIPAGRNRNERVQVRVARVTDTAMIAAIVQQSQSSDSFSIGFMSQKFI